jgi:branched-chain amino acid transport system substrate-binding protein
MHLFRLGSAVVAASLVALACGGGGGGGSTKGTLKIGVDLPISGNDASDGIPTLNGIRFAINQTNDNGGVQGYKLDLVVKDDVDPAQGKHDPQKGAQNMQALVADSSVVGVVGPFNSNVAKAEIPIANRASLTLISPANTNPCLTKNLATCDYHPADLRPSGSNNYFRVAATDDHQGGAMADYAAKTLNLQKVAVVSDHETYGKGIADAFAAQFQKDGGTVVDDEDLDTATMPGFQSLMTKFKSKGAQGVYFGGTSSNNGCKMRNQAKNIFGTDSPFLGGDGIVDAHCLDDAADMAAGITGTVASADAANTSSAKSTIDAFKQKFSGPNDFGAYTVPGYTAAKMLIQGISDAIKSNNGSAPSRQQVLQAVSKLSGVSTPLGTMGFDQNGDTTQQIIAFYKVDTTGPSNALACGKNNPKTCWLFVKQVSFGGGGT